MQRIYKGRICTEKEFGRSDFPYLQDSVRVFFKKKKQKKKTKGSCDSNSVFCNPWKLWYTKNNRKSWHKSKFKKEKWRFWAQCWHAFSIFTFYCIFFHILSSLYQLLVWLQYCAKFSTKPSDFFFENYLTNSNKNNFFHFFDIFWVYNYN